MPVMTVLEFYKRLTAATRTAVLVGALQQCEAALSETQKLVSKHYRPPGDTGYQVPSHEDMAASIKKTDDALSGLARRIGDRRAMLLAEEWTL